MSAMPLMIVVLCCLAIAYRYYSAFLAAKVAVLDDSRPTPAHTLNDGQNYHPTNKWVLFGHHFAAISGAGPLIGPVLAIQYGYLPGLIWIVIGVCLAGAVQDMLVLAASVRRNGRSLAEIVRAEISPLAGGTASLAILVVVVIALAGLGTVVVKALGGEENAMEAKSKILVKEGEFEVVEEIDGQKLVKTPPNTTLISTNRVESLRSESFTIKLPKVKEGEAPVNLDTKEFVVPPGTVQQHAGSSWATFTIACTIPIALFIGLYMYKIRKGRVVEASLIGAVGVLWATAIGYYIPHSPLEPYFSLSRGATIWAICGYGFIASVLPVWLLLCPRDYLSSFLKIGTIVLLVVAVIVANPTLKAPAINTHFAEGGPVFRGPIFPFCFICIMCGAISGFHSLVSSGTTPKMIGKESQVRMIGYGAMLIEGLVAVVALIAAASLPLGDYYAINTPLNLPPELADKYNKAFQGMEAERDNLGKLEELVGGESLRGRTGGAVTLAVGMSNIMTEATKKVAGDKVNIEGMIQYWFHFAIMFEALFILTTIDTGTRIARFLLQEFLGKFFPKFDKTDWIPGAVLSDCALITAAWGLLIATGSIDTIWPMFGIANQLLAVIALAVVTAVMVNSGRQKYAWVTIPPMLFVITSTSTAGYQLITERFWGMIVNKQYLMGTLNIAMTMFMILSTALILWETVNRCLAQQKPQA